MAGTYFVLENNLQSAVAERDMGILKNIPQNKIW